MYKSSFIFALVLIASQSIAFSGNNGWLTIDDFTLWSNTYTTDTVRIEIDGDYYNPANCTDTDSMMVAAELSEEARARIYSTLLAAKLSSTPVKLFIDSSSCERTRPKVLNVVLE